MPPSEHKCTEDLNPQPVFKYLLPIGIVRYVRTFDCNPCRVVLVTTRHAWQSRQKQRTGNDGVSHWRPI